MNPNKKEAHIDIELSNKAGEVAVLEVLVKQLGREFRLIPYDEAIVRLSPRNQLVRGLVIDHLIAFDQEGR